MVFDPHAPRKPFVARGSRISRCTGCLLPARFCLCQEQPHCAAGAVFWLLTHKNEIYKPTNTGRLITRAIADSQVFIWQRLQPSAELAACLEDKRFFPVVVFPQEQGHVGRMLPLEELRLQAAGRVPAFIILDGTWRQARRMFRLSPYLQHLPVAQPNQGRQSDYKLRKATEGHQLCTAEVAIALLHDMQEYAPAHALESYFQLFNHCYHRARSNAGGGSDLARIKAELKGAEA